MWRLRRGSITVLQDVLNHDAIYSVNQNYSLTINNFNPLLYGEYQCILTYDIPYIYDSSINGEYAASIPVSVANTTSDSSNKRYVFTATTINNVVASEGQQTNLSCRVSVTSDESIGIKIDDNIITTSHSSCVDNFETATRKCNNTYNNFDAVLICDYSVSYEVDCTLPVNAPVNTSSIAHCIADGVEFTALSIVIGAREYHKCTTNGIRKLKFSMLHISFTSTTAWLE